MSKDTLATIIHNFLPIFNAKNKLPTHKLRVLDALQKCRTEYMGGHIEACDSCGETRIAFNSCRNRHCPQCGGIDKERWIINREADLLPVQYFHVVFTVPDKLNLLFLNNQRQMYNLLFTTAWDTLASFGRTQQWAGGKLGATAILHTWGQNLNYHPHLHFIVPAGVLLKNNRWKSTKSKGKYLFEVKQLSKVFRAKFVEGARELLSNKLIEGRVPNNLFIKPWVVYAKRPFGGPQNVIKYLSRYTHRTAISNDRILNVSYKEVVFSWRDYKHNYAKRITSIKGEDFLNLFSQHILPSGFTRIRHYGFLSSAAKSKSLAIIRMALDVEAPPKLSKEEKTVKALQNMGVKHGVCSSCGGNMQIIKTIANKFRNSARAPPKIQDLTKLNYSICDD
ncbi:MAG: IS91 family transposase [Bacteroidales bacterium]|nr:IS91 family transposase [Bacteroidales bacterium]